MKEKRKESKHKKHKKTKKHKHHKEKRREDSSSSSGSESDEWVEQVKEKQESSQCVATSSRDDWMSMTGMIQTYSKDDIKTDRKEKEKKHIDSYNPSTSTRELNPFWKDGGMGLPETSQTNSRAFKRPEDSSNLYKCSSKRFHNDDYSRSKSPRHDDRSKSPRHDDRSKSPRHDRSHSGSNCDKYSGEKRHDRQDYFKSRSSSKREFIKPSKSYDLYEKSDKTRGFDKSKNKTEESEGYYRSSSSWKKRSSDDKRDKRHDYKRESRGDDNRESRENSPSDNNKEEPMLINDIKETKPPPESDDKYLSDEKMNKLAAKIVKAEILGDTALVIKLKNKLETARAYRKDNPDAGKSEEIPDDIMLLSTNSRGDSRPLTKSSQSGDPRSRGGKRKAETHAAGERMKYFSNDDKSSLSQMFEQEKYGSNYDDESQLAKIAARHTNPNDDLEDIFTEQISKNVSSAKQDEKNKQRAIKEHQTLERSLEGCQYCVGSKAMMKHLIVSLGNKVYLSVPPKASLTKGHCVITTVQHAACVTAVDEDVWEEILNFRKALVKFFNSQDQDVVFFETASRLHKYPHLVVNCVPMPRDVGDTAPIYFKKALLECEAEWAMNKKVVELKGRSVRKRVPKGLPYFWVDFGMDPGFAHVIEDQQLFPDNFAEEIIGGILDLDHRLWKRPSRESGDELRRKVSEFVREWKQFDTVSKNKV